MKIATILDHIDTGYMALPGFQRGYVWNRDQVRGLYGSLYRHHPIGSLLVWVTESQTANYRGDGALAPGMVKLLLDGQQRMTSLYGVIRGKPPKFFDGNQQAFTGLRFHLETESFEFFQPIKMKDDQLWVDVTDLMRKGPLGLGEYVAKLSQNPIISAKIPLYIGRLSQLLSITEIDLHIEEVAGADKTLDVVVDIFNLVNSGGTKLSKGDLALAKICAEWPEARQEMKDKLAHWAQADYAFSLDWLLRSLNTVLTGEAKFQFLHNKNATEVKDGLNKASKHIDTCLNLISGRVGIDHDRVFFGRFAVPIMVRHLDLNGKALTDTERDKMLFWFIEAGMWGRFSSSTESYIDKDLETIDGTEAGLDKLIDQLKAWHSGGLRVEPANFTGWSLGARFYPILYMLTRMGGSCDWGTGLTLKASLLGNMNRLEVHHIFPKAQLYKLKMGRSDVNALANYCFLTKDTNLDISDRLPELYFPEIEKNHPGALASQWIPMDKELWKIENYRGFMEARKNLLAEEMNKRLADLLHGNTSLLAGPIASIPIVHKAKVGDEELEALNTWIIELELPGGEFDYDFADPDTGEQKAIFDLAWPSGLQKELSQPIAIILNENNDTIAIASGAGFRCFTTVDDFKGYVEKEIIGAVMA
jgi:hypothetical protein